MSKSRSSIGGVYLNRLFGDSQGDDEYNENTSYTIVETVFDTLRTDSFFQVYVFYGMLHIVLETRLIQTLNFRGENIPPVCHVDYSFGIWWHKTPNSPKRLWNGFKQIIS